MSATSSTAQPPAGAGARNPLSSAEIDASCRAPLLLMFTGAVVWLVVASILGFIATLKFHSPEILADCAWFTYGRVHPASVNAFIYGFAAQAGLGVMLWLLCHLGRTRLACGPGTVIGALTWNFAVTMGVIGILYGESTGYEWLEMPRYGSIPLFIAYLIIGLGAMLTFHQRRERPLYISQWFILAALFWFPWIFTTAEFLLVLRPVRGVVQAAIDGWYSTNLNVVWFGFIGLATLFYFVPKLVQRPLYSSYLAVFTFWTLGMFGSWGAVAAGSPFPAWLPAQSTFGALLTIVPVLAVALNLHRTFDMKYSALAGNFPLKFLVFGTFAYVAAGVIYGITSLESVSRITNFTWVIPAQTQLALYGFLAMTLFGALYYIVPRISGFSFSPRFVAAQFWLSAAGLLLYFAPLFIGGISQGFSLNDANTAFLSIIQSSIMFFRVATMGELLMLLGNLLLLLNLAILFNQMCKAARASLKTDWLASAKTSGVPS